MSYVGKWSFHSIGTINDSDEFIYLSAQEYLDSPMPYVDETDEEAVADEIKERKGMIGSKLAVCEDGKAYMLMPLPEGVSMEEVDQAVNAGHIKLYDGMMTDEPFAWQERDGEFWADMGTGEFIKVSDENGFITLMTTRYVKAE